ncbi:unnamed protein product [Cuscuta epithymum]|uniref:Uncharacterized protein n=1 Tax=Cuscuta epithymum TaxID=186058 RepID=A0AAV0CFC9_9ASTE|nr:unnamed protein product [Cuscuta epithymum]
MRLEPFYFSNVILQVLMMNISNNLKKISLWCEHTCSSHPDCGILIEKLPESWRDYRRDLKHDLGLMSFNDVITHIIIEDTNRKENAKCQAKEYTSNANLVETENKRSCGCERVSGRLGSY